MVVDELVDRQQFDRRDTDGTQVIEHGRRGDPGVGTPEVLGHVGVGHGEAA